MSSPGLFSLASRDLRRICEKNDLILPEKISTTPLTATKAAASAWNRTPPLDGSMYIVPHYLRRFRIYEEGRATKDTPNLMPACLGAPVRAMLQQKIVPPGMDGLAASVKYRASEPEKDGKPRATRALVFRWAREVWAFPWGEAVLAELASR